MYAANDETATMMTPIATIATNTYAARELRSLPTKECFREFRFNVQLPSLSKGALRR